MLPRGITNRASLMVGHAFQHLDFHQRFDAMNLTQSQRQCHIEQIVTGDSQANGIGVGCV